MKLAGSVWVVTGGASGLGEATSRMLAAQGAKVGVWDLNDAAAGKLAAELGGVACKVDVADEASIDAALKAVVAKFGTVHGVLNAAGIPGSGGKPIPTVNRGGRAHPVPPFMKSIAINLVGTFAVASKCAEVMAKNKPDEDGGRGVIINVASVAAFDGQNGQVAYSASKGGVAAMTLPMARDMGRYGVRVVCVAPGVFDTPMGQGLSKPVKDGLIKQQIFPGDRLGNPTEFAHTVRYIAENAFLTGETIRLDAGVRMPKL